MGGRESADSSASRNDETGTTGKEDEETETGFMHRDVGSKQGTPVCTCDSSIGRLRREDLLEFKATLSYSSGPA